MRGGVVRVPPHAPRRPPADLMHHATHTSRFPIDRNHPSTMPEPERINPNKQWHQPQNQIRHAYSTRRGHVVTRVSSNQHRQWQWPPQSVDVRNPDGDGNLTQHRAAQC
jgi:hypothetical protein